MPDPGMYFSSPLKVPGLRLTGAQPCIGTRLKESLFTSASTKNVRLSILPDGLLRGSVGDAEHVDVRFSTFVHDFEAKVGESRLIEQGHTSLYLSQQPLKPDSAPQGLYSIELAGLIADPDGLRASAPLLGELVVHATRLALEAVPDKCGLISLADSTISPLAREVNIWACAEPSSSSLHYDARDNVLLVCQGRKVVAVVPPQAAAILELKARPVSDVSPNHAHVDIWSDALPPALSGMVQTYSLEPGDALLLPAGWWHAVRSDHHTVAFNVWMDWRRAERGAGTGAQHVADPIPSSSTVLVVRAREAVRALLDEAYPSFLHEWVTQAWTSRQQQHGVAKAGGRPAVSEGKAKKRKRSEEGAKGGGSGCARTETEGKVGGDVVAAFEAVTASLLRYCSPLHSSDSYQQRALASLMLDLVRAEGGAQEEAVVPGLRWGTERMLLSEWWAWLGAGGGNMSTGGDRNRGDVALAAFERAWGLILPEHIQYVLHTTTVDGQNSHGHGSARTGGTEHAGASASSHVVDRNSVEWLFQQWWGSCAVAPRDGVLTLTRAVGVMRAEALTKVLAQIGCSGCSG